jgi:hypothetical protein
MVSMEDLGRLRAQEERIARRQTKLLELQEYFDQFPADEWEREVEKAFDEMREERRASHRAKTGTES